MKRSFLFGIAAVIVLAIAIFLFIYVVADNIVGDAVNKLNVDSGSPSPIHIGVEDVVFADNFLITNEADIPLKLEYVNITFYVTSFPSAAFHYVIGNIVIRNETVDVSKQIGIPVSFNITSEDALNQIYSLSYHVGWNVDVTASGSYLFWHFTKQTTITRP